MQRSLLFGLFLAISHPVAAQIAPDGTTSTTVTPTAEGVEINNGDVAGSNLFHSFDRFSIPTGTEAHFNNPDSISNIFSRVTGGNVSNINGILKANGTANLFLINPAGIVFGEGARLQIGGSFYGSTADSIVFPDGEFSANLDNPPLITVNAPIGLNFRDAPQPITNEANFGTVEAVIDPGTEIEYTAIVEIAGLEVAEGKNITLVGGDINLQGSGTTAPGGNIELGGLSESGTVGINSDGSLSFPEDTARSNVSLTENALVDVRGDGNGFIRVYAENLTLTDKGRLYGGIAEGMGREDAVAGDIIIDATESVQIVGTGDFPEGTSQRVDTGIISQVGLPPALRTTENSTAIGQGGSIVVNTDSLDISVNDAGIFSLAHGVGDSGMVDVRANTINITDTAIGTITFGRGDALDVNLNADTIDLNNGNLISQIIGETAEGNGGDINVTARVYRMNGGFIGTDNGSLNQGDAGDINITARESIDLESVTMLSIIQPGAAGDSGNVRFVAPEINISQTSFYSFISTENRSNREGNGGNITLEARDSINIGINGQLFATVPQDSTGDAGNISLTAPNISLEGASVIASTSGEGNGGNLTVTASNALEMDSESKLFSQVGETGVGNAGSISVFARSVNLDDKSFILSDTDGVGDSGMISLNIEESLSVRGESAIVAGVKENGFGDGSDIAIASLNILVTGGAGISSGTRGQGNSGNILIDTDVLTLRDFAAIASSTSQVARGTGGEITINANSITLDKSSGINAFTSSVFDGGEITIAANTLELTRGGTVFTGANSTGNAGNIVLNIAQSISADGANSPTARPADLEPTPDPFSDFLIGRTGLFANTSDVSQGNGGSIFVDTNDIDLANNAEIGADSFGTGAGGSIALLGETLDLNGGIISARTLSGERGNINLQIRDRILLENNSSVSAEALREANGGNITIDTEFIIATPNQNSDIVASAAQGNGGNININAEALLGIEQGELNPVTNDINASSEFGLDGSIAISTPDVNSLRETAELSDNVVATEIVAASNACRADDSNSASSLVVNGRGGVAPKPTDPFGGESIIAEDLTPQSPTANKNPHNIQPVAYKDGEPIYIARGIIPQADGSIILTAYPTAKTPARAASSSGCDTPIDKKPATTNN